MSHIDTSDVVAVTQNLLQSESVTPAHGDVFDKLERMLVAIGFDVERPTFTQSATPDVENLYARIGQGKPHLMFAGHVDVVPTGDVELWSHAPFSGTIVDGKLFGRGAVDMKGGVGAFVAAASRYLQANAPQGTISLLITGDEEGPAINGSAKLLQWARNKGEAWDHCILGEPTNSNHVGDVIKVGRRGSYTGTLKIDGVQGHVAYPHLSANPVPVMAQAVAQLSAAKIDDGTDVFQPTNLEFLTIDVGNPATNVIPAQAKARFNIRFNDLQSPASLEAHIRAIIEPIITAPFKFTLEFMPCNSHVFRTETGQLLDHLQAAILDVTGVKPELTTSGGTSDGRFIKDYCPILEFGLVGQTMHQIDEHTKIEDLLSLCSIYEGLLKRYFDHTT